MRSLAACVLCTLPVIAGCGFSRAVPAQSPISAGAVPVLRGASPIKHVVLVIQENRTFDNLFATFPGADGTRTGRMGSKRIRLHKAALIESCDFGHSRSGFIRDYNDGEMNGFYLERGTKRCPGNAERHPYQYVAPELIEPYWYIARHYVLGDHMFSTQGSGSFSAHQDLIRGGTTIDRLKLESLVDYPTHEPWGCDAPAGTVTSYLLADGKTLMYEPNKGPFPCTRDFPSSGAYYHTLRDLLDAKSISWKYYVPRMGSTGALWNAFEVIAPVRYGAEWKTNISSPETNIYRDISNGKLAAISWVIPDEKNSDHPASASDTGPSWVAGVINAIGSSSYWRSTAVIVVWDDWGGFYDHEPPPLFDSWGGMGFRVPLLIVSPYARETSASQPGFISHTRYEFGSILKFIEDTWHLGSLGTTDARARSLGDSFDFSQTPRAFQQIPSNYSRAYFLRERPSNRAVDTE